MPQNAVTAQDVNTALQANIDVDVLNLTLRMTAGWIVGRTSFGTLTPTVPDDVWSAWLELTMIQADNPTSMVSNQAGEQVSTWSLTDRREIILRNLAEAYPRTAQAPLAAFPAPLDNGPWPDPSSDVNTFRHGVVKRYGDGSLRPWV